MKPKAARPRRPAEGLLLGAHVPVAGGLANAPAHGVAIGATAIQVFTRNHRQWACRPLSAEEPAAFKAALAESGIGAVMAHASYLVNLASTSSDFLQRSRHNLAEEVLRCHQLGIPSVVVHPGAHMGAGERAGLTAVARSLDDVHARTPGARPRVLLEVTAGQGTCLGHRFEHLAEILMRVKAPERVGVCLDTCHLLAAGYDVASPRGYEDTMAELHRRLGARLVMAVHLNDSRTPRGSRVDRHVRAGQGHLGLAALRRFVKDPRLRGV
ncbi:MAG TPA: deoxyribonuclease IV, partial [Vicinamibacteria bacterium]|nr:deoxyribonuclease IV [Vicinamibacteria bacterium]